LEIQQTNGINLLTFGVEISQFKNQFTVLQEERPNKQQQRILILFIVSKIHVA